MPGTATSVQNAVADPRLAGLRRLVVVPALNEQGTLQRVIEEIRAFDPGCEIVVVDDGSTDRTASVAVAAGAQLLRLPFNLGIGGAVQTGYRFALEHGFDIVVQVDGDGQHVPGELPKLLGPLLEGTADLVIGSRFAAASGYRAPLSRRLGMRWFAALVSMIVGQALTDTSSSFRALNRRSLRLFGADYPHGYLETVEATVLAAKHGLRIMEVPVLMREREHGRSSLTIPLSLYYSLKVVIALFVGLFRRPIVQLEEEE